MEMEKAIEASKTQLFFKSTSLQLRAGAYPGLEARARPLELFFVKSSPARPWIPKDTGAAKSASTGGKPMSTKRIEKGRPRSRQR